MTEQVMLAIGDSAGPPAKNPGAAAVAALATNLMYRDPNAIALFLGDNAYNRGTQEEYDQYFVPRYGGDPFKDRSRACPGNHDYLTFGAAPYFRVFGEEAAGTPSRSYYSFDVGGWHVVSLNSEVEQDNDSAQLRWLREDLTKTSGPILAFWHRARWGSGGHWDSKKPRWFWKELSAHRAEIVLSGHSHHYERFDRQTPKQKPDDQGIRQFIVGSGGRKLKGRTKHTPNSVHSDFESHGLLKLSLRPSSYSWEYIAANSVVLDRGDSPTNHT